MAHAYLKIGDKLRRVIGVSLSRGCVTKADMATIAPECRQPRKLLSWWQDQGMLRLVGMNRWVHTAKAIHALDDAEDSDSHGLPHWHDLRRLLDLMKRRPRIRAADLMGLSGIARDTAKKRLQRWHELGHLARVKHGVYALPGTPPDPLSDRRRRKPARIVTRRLAQVRAYCLEHGTITIRGLIDLTGIEKASAETQLYRWHRSGDMKRLFRGVYGLPDQQPKPPPPREGSWLWQTVEQLKLCPMTDREIAAILDISRCNARVELARWEQRGYVRRREDGRYEALT